jgi:hypothetical protein
MFLVFLTVGLQSAERKMKKVTTSCTESKRKSWLLLRPILEDAQRSSGKHTKHISVGFDYRNIDATRILSPVDNVT